MQQAELKLSEDSGYELTGSKKQRLYIMLLPIQADIMNILLSDLDTGKGLMERYKALVSEFDKSEEISMDLMNKMVDLENDVKDAKENASKVRSEAYTNKCDELLLHLNKNTIEQTQRSLESLRESFRKRSGDFTLKEVTQIGNMLASLRFFIIREKRKANPNLDLQGEISEEEIKQLESTFSYEAIKLLNSEKPREQFVGKQIRDDLALLDSGENSVVYDGTIWDKFASVPMLPQDKQILGETEQLPNKSSSLAIVPKKNNIWDKIRNAFRNIRDKVRQKN